MTRPGLRNKTHDNGDGKAQQRSSKRKKDGQQTPPDSDGGSPNKASKVSESGKDGETDDTAEDMVVPNAGLDGAEGEDIDEIMTDDMTHSCMGAEEEQPPAEPLQAQRQKITASAATHELNPSLRRRPIRSKPLEDSDPSQKFTDSWSQTDACLPHTWSNTSYLSRTCFKEKQNVQFDRVRARANQPSVNHTILSQPSSSPRSWEHSIPNLTKSNSPPKWSAAPKVQVVTTSSNLLCEGRFLKWVLSGFLMILVILTPLSMLKTRQLEKEMDFSGLLADVRSAFPSQRAEFWHRSIVHLRRHLNTSRPAEPVTVMLTAGRVAERTLSCVASRMAAAFSAYHSASVLHINGTSKAALDSDHAKLAIDQELTEAFKGGKMAAVIHRLEELPPGSTLIFYKYCDHENAEFKKVLLIFTVLLPVEKLGSELSLVEVDEMVWDYLQERFLPSSKPESFNQMDYDKLGGLRSRISHLILPVSVEENIENNGCTN